MLQNTHPISASVFRPPDDSHPSGVRLSRSLGWFSLGLGLAELAAPHALARAIGIDPRGATGPTLRAMGVRECLIGLGVLIQPRRPRSLWARIAGDAVDLALLGLAAGTRRTSTPRLIGAVAAVAGVTALDVVAARRTQQAYDAANRPVISSVTINKPREQVYAFYRRLSQLPLFMDYLESVRELDQRRSHWVAKLPLGTVQWDAEITEDRPGELLAWRSVEGSKLKVSGRVTFTRTPGRDMTEVRVELRLGFLGTRPSTALATMFARPQIKGDLRRLKQVLETGEVLYSDASLHRRPYPAQPAPAEELPQLLRSAMPFIESPPTAMKGVTP